ncbi:MAG: Rid family hydrolase [Pseudomonadota bacterium]
MSIIIHNPKTLFPQYTNYSHAVEVEGGSRLLFISGLNGYEPDGMTMPSSFEDQCEIIWGYIGEILQSANMNYEHIISLRTFLASPEYDKACSIVRARYLADHRPASTTLCCQLLETHWKLEIEVIAAN